MKQTLPNWWPDQPPVYNIEKSYLENAEEGPFFDGQIPPRSLPPKKMWFDFLGFKIASRLGIPAGPLLNSRWIAFAAKMGFDVLTYKTMRSQSYPAHSLPNMVYIDTKGDLTPSRFQEPVYQTLTPSKDIAQLAATNSFGMPSRDPGYLVEDIERANRLLNPGQVMIVSVVGTPRPNEDFILDFATASQIALDGGAKIIEANFSCPNVKSSEGSIYSSPEAVFDVSHQIKQTIGSVPLIIKIGTILDKKCLREVMLAAAKAGVEGFCGINTVNMKVIKKDGSAALGENRLNAGVCGGPIRQVAIDFIRTVYAINREEKLDLTIMGTGGITHPDHFDLFFEAGAEIAMSAVGMMWDPYLAARYHLKHLGERND